MQRVTALEDDLTALRAAYVSHTFSEEQHFNCSDIERWLEGQRNAPEPEMGEARGLTPDHGVTGWTYLIGKHGDSVNFRGGMIAFDLLRSLGARVREVGDKLSEHHTTRLWHLWSLISSLDEQGWGVYLTQEGAIAIEPGSLDRCLLFQPGGGSKSGMWRAMISYSNVARSIVTAWQYANRVDIGAGHDRGLRARDHLCDWLDNVITPVRTEAEKSFDCAVAVSHAGTKIVHADWVVKQKRESCWVRVYRGEEWWKRKLIRHPEMDRWTNTTLMPKRGEGEMDHQRVAGTILFASWESNLKSEAEQYLITLGDDTHPQTCLVCQIDEDDPFPEGGITFGPGHF